MNGAVESLGFDNPISLLFQLLSDHNTDQIIQVLEKLFQLKEEKTGSCNRKQQIKNFFELPTDVQQATKKF